MKNKEKQIEKIGLTQSEIITVCEMIHYLNDSLIYDSDLSKYVNLDAVHIELDRLEYLDVQNALKKLINHINN